MRAQSQRKTDNTHTARELAIWTAHRSVSCPIHDRKCDFDFLTPPYGRERRTKEPFDESERGE